jgi:hypothetical protein
VGTRHTPISSANKLWLVCTVSKPHVCKHNTNWSTKSCRPRRVQIQHKQEHEISSALTFSGGGDVTGHGRENRGRGQRVARGRGDNKRNEGNQDGSDNHDAILSTLAKCRIPSGVNQRYKHSLSESLLRKQNKKREETLANTSKPTLLLAFSECAPLSTAPNRKPDK